MLLGFVVHAGGYKIMVGAYNTVDVTVERQMHTGGRAAFFRAFLRFIRLTKFTSPQP